MRTTLPLSQARRRLRRLIALVATGQSFVITKNGREICRLQGESIQQGKIAEAAVVGSTRKT